jgi:hypothetical protein
VEGPEARVIVPLNPQNPSERAAVDNFEGLAAVPRPDSGVRFYQISDDNALVRQRTLQLAFDWRPR